MTADRPTQLGSAFYAETPLLDHLRRFAGAQLAAPAAVFAELLVRLAACVPVKTRIASPLRDPGLNLLVGVVAKPAGGKSHAWNVAKELLPTLPPDALDDLRLGSGEGLIESHLGPSIERNDGTRHRPITHPAIVWYCDEGQTLRTLVDH